MSSPSDPSRLQDSESLPELLAPSDRVLSTLNRDGSRRWLRPRVSPGRFLTGRRIVAYALIAIFTAIPYVRIHGKPAMLLDITRREFTLFGFTFLPTDTVLLALFLIAVFISIFFVTALFGRIWCGWACPQTVYMEFLYRPIERFFEGAPGKKAKAPGPLGLRKALKFATFLVCAMFLAHTFLAYFVGVDQLFTWIQSSPGKHPVAFIVMAATTGLMLFDFGFFREQVCLVACPYGRFQSVMLDRNSLIISYDTRRGEPRGKLKRTPRPDADVSLKVLNGSTSQGDCIDCHMCVTTCPTGIDIREGLQMECIGCAQCIDACDSVMDKIGRARGLIRYSSQSAMEGRKWSIVRPRLLLYPVVLAVLATLFALNLKPRTVADVSLLRGRGQPFVMMDDGSVSNQLRVKLTNRGVEAREFLLQIDGIEGGKLIVPSGNPMRIEPGDTQVMDILIVAPASVFVDGSHAVNVSILLDGEVIVTRPYRIVGPDRPSLDRAPSGAETVESSEEEESP